MSSPLKQFVRSVGRTVLLSLPISVGMRLRLIHVVYTWLGAMFACMPHYETWRRSQRARAGVARKQAEEVGDPWVQLRSLGFPASDAPRVSIIVLLPKPDESFEAAIRCLVALKRHWPQSLVEVIAAGAHATTPDAEQLSAVSGLHCLDLPAPPLSADWIDGVLAVSRGAFVQVLDGTVEVTQGWLDEQIQTFDRFADCGMVGSKLVDRSGCLVEAGGVAWRDGQFTCVGHGDDPTASQYGYARRVDFCSAASLLLRVEHLRATVSLASPERTLDAGLEAVDLAFRLRTLQLNVYYQPKSMVVVSSEAAPAASWSVWLAPAAAAVDAFRSRWRTVLERDHALHGQRWSVAVERAFGRKTALIVDQYVPRPDRDAGSRAIDQVVELLLSSGWVVKFWPHNAWYEPGYTERLEARGVEVFYGAQYSGRFEKWLAGAADRLDAVFLSRPEVAVDYIAPLRRMTSARLLLYGHDIHYLRMEQQSEVDPANGPMRFEISRMRRIERRIWSQVDAVCYLSNTEVEEVRRIAPGVLALQLPIFGYSGFPTPMPPSARGAPDVLFVSGFGHPPNVDAAQWFVGEVWPRVLARLPAAKLSLVGASPTPSVQALTAPSVRVTGRVTEGELSRFYERARVCVVPLRFGAGVKGKTVEALRWGVPVVSTSVGAQGMPGVESVLRLHDEPGAFANAVVDLLSDDEQWHKYSRRGQAYVRQHFSADALRRAVERALNCALAPPTDAQPLVELRVAG